MPAKIQFAYQNPGTCKLRSCRLKPVILAMHFQVPTHSTLCHSSTCQQRADLFDVVFTITYVVL